MYFIMESPVITISFLGALLSLTLSWSSFWLHLLFCILAVTLVLFLLLSPLLFLQADFFELISFLCSHYTFCLISLLVFCDTWQHWWFSKLELGSRIESITFCLMLMSPFQKLFSDLKNLIFSLSNNTLSFSLFESSGFSFSLFSFNYVIPFLRSKILLNKCDFNAAILLSSLYSNDLI